MTDPHMLAQQCHLMFTLPRVLCLLGLPQTGQQLLVGYQQTGLLERPECRHCIPLPPQLHAITAISDIAHILCLCGLFWAD